MNSRVRCIISVSYTHLDVYKRQTYGHTKTKVAKENSQLTNCELIGENKDSAHNIYLSLIHIFPAGRNSMNSIFGHLTECWKGDGSAETPSVFETGAVKAKANAVLGRFGVRGIKAVSYTNLDVYKRQGQAGAADERTAEKRDRREGGADGAEPEHGAVCLSLIHI